MLPPLLQPSSLGRFRRQLLRWYDREKRKLPWRDIRDPYRVWVSEIMLQQTRVAAVLAHYRRFLRRFPTVERLARARESAVLAAWSGLGYYRRARRLHQAARQVVQQGSFPATAAAWRELPGVGRYTAAAIASIVFGEPAAVVDGNVERVLQRLLGGGRHDPWEVAGTLLSRKRPGDFNQAVMELGATVCLPGEPACPACPVRRFCATQGRGPATATAARRRQKIAYALALRDGCVLLRQRPPAASLMPGMWELPQPNGRRGAPLFSLRHSITNTDFEVTVARLRTAAGAHGRWIRVSRLAALPLTGLARKILKRACIIQ